MFGTEFGQAGRQPSSGRHHQRTVTMLHQFLCNFERATFNSARFQRGEQLQDRQFFFFSHSSIQ